MVVEEREVGGIENGNTKVTGQSNAELDLRGVICPYNFVKTKLMLEAMEQGEVLSVLLDDGDPIRNVPSSMSNEGPPSFRKIAVKSPIECLSVAVKTSNAEQSSVHLFSVRSYPIPFNDDRDR